MPNDILVHNGDTFSVSFRNVVGRGIIIQKSGGVPVLNAKFRIAKGGVGEKNPREGKYTPKKP